MICDRFARRPVFRRSLSLLAVVFGVAVPAANALGGPFSHVGVPGRIGGELNPAFVAWADSVVDYSPTSGVLPSNNIPSRALGPVGTTTANNVVSLGDLSAEQIGLSTPPGSITLGFANPAMNGPDWDLAIFENAFSVGPLSFAELAYVEVSTNGLVFARFPNDSLTTEETIDDGFGRNFALIDPTDVRGLAGFHGGLTGTAFDLSVLSADPAVVGGQVDLDEINFVRIVDIPGNGAFLDSMNRPILDAWDTTDAVGNGGFDLDAVGVRYAVPEPSSALLAMMGAFALIGLRRRSRA